jgi:hypothetical protein
MTMRRLLIGSAALILMASLTSGCASYDYLQRTDRISYRAGNAVQANLERESINTWDWSMYDTGGLGKNGAVIPDKTAASGSTAPTPAPATAPAVAPTPSPQ